MEPQGETQRECRSYSPLVGPRLDFLLNLELGSAREHRCYPVVIQFRRPLLHRADPSYQL